MKKSIVANYAEISNNLSKNNTYVDQNTSKIIKNADLRFSSSNLNESYKKINTAVLKNKGIIQIDNSGKDYVSFYRNLTVRIPSNKFDEFLNQISDGVNYFDRKDISSEDVTETYIDLNARLNAKRKLENRYLDILNKASKVSEILEIEKELAIIREEVESKQAQLKHLESKVSMSTFTIEMYTESASGNEATNSFGQKIINALKSGFNGISSFFIGILHIWPFILILAVSFYFVRRKFRKK